jgi:UDP-N-acetylmuramoyl-tripeptide--D-alanyl-D-alanine ligase
MKLSEIASIIGARGQLDEALAQVEPRGFSIDSRTIQSSDLFFAIKGPTHDGHGFVASALEKGACAAIVSRESSDLSLEIPEPKLEMSNSGLPIANPELGISHFTSHISHPPLLFVEDTLIALQTLARTVRERWGGPVIGITGSAGKTGTKDLTARVLAASGAQVVKSMGNYNNAFGLPLSLLQIVSAGVRPEDVKYVVLEMGMSAPGELTQLCSIAQPDVGVVTLVTAAHLAFFPDVDAIAEAKAELVDHIRDDGVAVLNLDDPRVARMRFRRLVTVRTFGIEQSADVMATNIRLRGLQGAHFILQTPRGAVEVEWPLLGRHNIYNALAAAAVADYYGIPLERIAEELAQAAPSSKRGEVIRFSKGFTVIDDAYNSNPRALKEMVAAIGATNSVARRIVVAGEMLELGARAPELHREVGRDMARRGVDMVIGVRGLAREIVAGARQEAMSSDVTHFCETPEAAARWLFDNLQNGDLVLVKGSRGVQMERVIEELRRLSGETG